MTDLLAATAVMAVVIGVLAALAWFARMARRRNTAMLTVFDELYRASNHKAAAEIRSVVDETATPGARGDGSPRRGRGPVSEA